MTRFACAMFVAASISCLAYADVLDLLKGGLAARSRGDLDGAINFYTQAIATGSLSDANLAIVLGSRGVTFDMKGEIDKAIDDFNEAIHLKPDYGSAYIYRGLALVKKRDYRRAIADFTEAIARDPSAAFLALTDRANTYESISEYDEAIEDYGRAIQLNPSYTAAYFNRAEVRYVRGEYDDAIEDYSHAIALKPDYAGAYNNRGIAYQAKQEIDKALADFGTAIRLDPYDAVTLANRGTIYAAIGEFDRAVADFSSAIALKPDVTGFYAKRAQARLYTGQANAAITDLNAAIKLSPSDASAVIWLHLAHVRGAINDLPELRRVAADVDRNKWPGAVVDLYLGGTTPEVVTVAGLANINPKSQPERVCEVAFYLGTFELEKGNKAEAERRLQAAANICPTNLIELAAAKAELMRLNTGR